MGLFGKKKEPETPSYMKGTTSSGKSTAAQEKADHKKTEIPFSAKKTEKPKSGASTPAKGGATPSYMKGTTSASKSTAATAKADHKAKAIPFSEKKTEKPKAPGTKTPPSGMATPAYMKGTTTSGKSTAAQEKADHATKAIPFSEKKTEKPKGKTTGGDGKVTVKVGSTGSSELRKFMAIFQPYAEKGAAGDTLRKKGFSLCDPNGNGLVSLAEAETFVMKSLFAAYPKTKDSDVGRDLFDAFRPCYIRAFNDAKDYKADTGEVIEGTKAATADDFVSKGEFRYLCAYLCIYAAMFDAFAKIDGGGSGRDANDDKRIDEKEWLAGYKNVKDHGFVALANVKDEKSAKAVFAKIDGNGGGVLLFDEWCAFLKAAEIEAGTPTGDLLNADEDAPGGGGGGAKGQGAKGQGGPRAKASPNSFGMCVGKSASKEYFDFASVLEPYCDEAATALQDEGFKTADPNGNGLCSLAECETFLLKALVTKFPKTGKGKDMKEPGKDIWDAFRPCYIRSFKDAADYAKDDGKTIEGTKSAKQDDFVSRDEFRLFCVYAVIYAAMYDAFAKIDGGGSGRDANDDKRIVKDEWMKGYKGVLDYGFAALDGITDKKSADSLFGKIDDNGGGIVLLDEWCEFLKAGEAAAGTPVGKLLMMDEEGGVGVNYKLAGKAKVLGKPPKRSSKAAAPKGGGKGTKF